jgi:hypothetical protein
LNDQQEQVQFFELPFAEKTIYLLLFQFISAFFSPVSAFPVSQGFSVFVISSCPSNDKAKLYFYSALTGKFEGFQ